MKYRRLYRQELEDLRDDFVQFLAANSIPADDWEKLKKENPEATEQLIDLFSDIVWEKILSKINFLEMRRADAMRVIKFEEEKAEMIEIRMEEKNFDFTNHDTVRRIAEGSLDLNAFKPKVLKGSKTYSDSRERELFEYLERGARPCKEIFWNSVKSMIS